MTLETNLLTVIWVIVDFAVFAAVVSSVVIPSCLVMSDAVPSAAATIKRAPHLQPFRPQVLLHFATGFPELSPILVEFRRNIWIALGV